ncbi:MAG: restriction endonuclease [Fuerstiella sp.]
MKWFRRGKSDATTDSAPSQPQPDDVEPDEESAAENQGTDEHSSSWDRARLRSMLSSALISAIRSIADEPARKEVIAWFVQAREILDSGKPKKEVAKDLYGILSSKRIAQLLGGTAKTTLSSYKGSGLPLSIKAALPVAVLGGAVFGAQGAGIAAFGSAIGLPVVLILFLGTAGVTAVIEAFIKDKTVRDPLTKLLIAMLALESKRRASKELLRALREEIAVPKRQDLPDDAAERISALREMDPIDFERHVMSLFAAEGFDAGVTCRSNDFGVDGFVTHPDGLLVVQCKRNSLANTVGRPVVQQFKGVIEEQKALRGYIVTTSRFTNEARESAKLNDRIILVDCDELLKWHDDGKTLTSADAR